MNQKPRFGGILLGCWSYLLILLIIALAGASLFLFTGQPIWRATGKLLVTRWTGSLPLIEVAREDDRSLYETQIGIMSSSVLQQRVRERVNRPPVEIRDNLRGFSIARAGNADLILISVDSPSREFARDYANAIAEEFLKYRDEQRAQNAETALLQLTREINRLSQELKSANQRVIDYVEKHHLEGVAQSKPEPAAGPNRLPLPEDPQLQELQALRDDVARIKHLYDLLLDKLMMVDSSQNLSSDFAVSILEPAIVQRDRIYPMKAGTWALVVISVLVLGTIAAPVLALLVFWIMLERYQAPPPILPVGKEEPGPPNQTEY